MDVVLLKEIVLVFLFVVVIFCVCVPLKFAESLQRRGIDLFHSQRYAAIVSILNCFAAGIFLGTCLLHLFPDVRGIIDDALEKSGIPQGFPVPEFTIALGFFLLLTIEQIISYFREIKYTFPDSADYPSSSAAERLPFLSSETTEIDVPATGSSVPPVEIINHEQNTSIRVVALIIALSIHSTFEGIAIGVQSTVDSVVQITSALVIHKIVIAFSLGLTLTQSPLGKMKSFFSGAIFALASPVGIGIGVVIVSIETSAGSLIVGTLQGMAAGSFLYVTFLEVLPHEFRSGHLHIHKLISFIFGFSVICAAILLFPDE